MQVSVESIGSLGRRMMVQLPAEDVEREIDARLKSVGKRAKLKGFRPGKAPMKVIRQHYGAQVRQEVLSELMQSSYARAITQEALQPAGGPKIETQSIEPGKDLEYSATFEIYPEIELKGLADIKVERSVAEVTDDDVDRMLENLRWQRAEWVEVDRGAEDRDRVIVDFVGTISGIAFEGGSGEKVSVEVGSGQMLASFESGLNSITAGEERTIEVVFPDDYYVRDLVGKTAEFKIKAHSVAERKLPEIDETLLESFGISGGGIEQLRSDVRGNMEREMAETIRSNIRRQVLDQLLEINPVELPQSLMDEEVEHMQREAAARMGGDENALPPREPFEEQARRRVGLGLLIAEVLRSNAIELDQARLEARAIELAAGYAEPQTAARAYLADTRARAQLEHIVLEDQAVDYLIEQGTVTDQPIRFRELMHFEQESQ